MGKKITAVARVPWAGKRGASQMHRASAMFYSDIVDGLISLSGDSTLIS